MTADVGTAEYVFAVEVRLDSADPDVRIEPVTFETTLFKRAPPPGEEGWLFFRNVLWRGEVNAPDRVRRLAEDALGLDVESVRFRELQAEESYYEAMKDEIADNLELFNAEDVPEVITKYLGSSIRVV